MVDSQTAGAGAMPTRAGRAVDDVARHFPASARKSPLIAPFGPAWALRTTSCVPVSPRAFSERRNAIQTAPSPLSPPQCRGPPGCRRRQRRSLPLSALNALTRSSTLRVETSCAARCPPSKPPPLDRRRQPSRLRHVRHDADAQEAGAGCAANVLCAEPLLVGLRAAHRLAGGGSVALEDLAQAVLGAPNGDLFPA